MRPWYDPPSEDELRELGFDFERRFGVEVEFFSDMSRDDVAWMIRDLAGVACHAEGYNHENNGYWKIVTDGSLGSHDDDDEDSEYNCDECDCDPHCDEDCEAHCEPNFYCYDCDRQNEDDFDEQACYQRHFASDSFCAEYNQHPNYDCDNCNVDRYCDQCCSAHCEPTYSNSGSGGMELVSPPLQGYAGICELHRVLQVLNDRCDPEIRDNMCGLHVHLDASDLDKEDLKRLALLYIRYERSIDELMPLSRRGSEAGCARSLLRGGERHGLNCDVNYFFLGLEEHPEYDVLSATRCWYDRYLKLNLTSYGLHGTVEFRHHSGTTMFGKILPWTIFCQKMVTAAKTHATHSLPTAVPDHTIPVAYLMRTIKAPQALRLYFYERHTKFEKQVAEQLRQRELAQQRMRDRYAAEQEHRRVMRWERSMIEAAREHSELDYRRENPQFTSNRIHYLPDSVTQAVIDDSQRADPRVYVGETAQLNIDPYLQEFIDELRPLVRPADFHEPDMSHHGDENEGEDYTIDPAELATRLQDAASRRLSQELSNMILYGTTTSSSTYTTPMIYVNSDGSLCPPPTQEPPF